MENFNKLGLHAIMWRRRWRRKRRNMWVHPINIKRPDFEIFSYLYPDPLEDEEKFHVFFRMNIVQFYCVTIGGRGNTKTKHQPQEGDYT